MAPTCWLCSSVGGGFRKWTMASACLSVWEEAVPQVSSWCPTLQFLPVCHWCLSSCHPGAGVQMGVSLSKSVCRFFKRNYLGLQKFLWLSPCWFLQPEVMGTYLPGTGILGWGTWCGRGTSSFLSYSFQIFVHHTWVWDQPVLRLSLLPVCMDVVSLIPWPLDFYSAGFLMVVSGGGSVVCRCGCARRRAVFPYTSILTGSGHDAFLTELTSWSL